MDVISYALAKKKAKVYTDEKFNSISGGFDYKGSVATIEDLPTGAEKGDEYTVGALGSYVWDGTAWVKASQRGEAGAPGAKGDPGEKGEKGDPGANSVSVSATGTSTNQVKYITIDGVESKLDSEAFKPMKSVWTGSNLTTSQAAELIMSDPDVKAGDAFAGGVSWSDLGTIGLSNGEATARVGDGKSFVLFTMSSSDTAPYEWNWNSFAEEWRSYVPIIDDLLSDSNTSALSANQGRVLAGMIDDVEDEIPDVINAVNNTSTTDALSANMGKALQDQVNNLKNIGRFLAIWDSSTGLPLTNPTTMPYTYRTGDYYRVGTVSSATPAVNYKPNGATYDGTASTTVETESVEVGWVYYYDGIQWLAQSAGGGGTVQDVQINGTTILDSGTGVANIPNSSSSASGVMTSAQYTKLDGIETGAQVNDLEGVQINGTDLIITDKKVDIPVGNGVLGALKADGFYQLQVDSGGAVNAKNISYANYDSGSANLFVGKGTLENVLDNESVRPDKAQTLTDTQKAQAVHNIGLATQDTIPASEWATYSGGADLVFLYE